jgi:hypothetical protein
VPSRPKAPNHPKTKHAARRSDTFGTEEITLTRAKPHVTQTAEPDGPAIPTDKDLPSKDDISAGSDFPPVEPSPEGATMNQDEATSVLAAVLSVIGDVVDLRGQKVTRPVLVRFAWFCAGAVFVLATVRPKSS